MINDRHAVVIRSRPDNELPDTTGLFFGKRRDSKRVTDRQTIQQELSPSRGVNDAQSLKQLLSDLQNENANNNQVNGWLKMWLLEAERRRQQPTATVR